MKFLNITLIFVYLSVLLQEGVFCTRLQNNNGNESKTKGKKFFASMKTSASTQMKSLFSLQMSSLKEMSVRARFQGYPIVSVGDEELGEGPIFYQGWEKYFVILGKAKNSDRRFLLNNEFEAQKKLPEKERTLRKEALIPDGLHFYFMLSEDYLSVVDSKIEDTRKTIDMCYIKNIDEIQVQKNNIPKGGIEDVGNFQEGFCFKIKGQTNKTTFKWIVCADDYQNKMTLMKKLITLRLRLQAKTLKKTETQATVHINIFDQTKKKKLGYGSSTKGMNKTEELKGKWIILQDWSTCTLACGGGTQTRHRYCVMPPNGVPCEGNAIETRPCNTEPCTNATLVEDNAEYLPTQVKILRVSKTPQRYKKCQYKEEDMDIVREDIPSLKVYPRVPSRVIMNNRTISFFESSTYDSLIKSFYLRELVEVKFYEEDPHRCIYISDKRKHIIMCVMINDIVRPMDKLNNWIRDINDFKNNCASTRKSVVQTDPRVKKFIHDLEEENMQNQVKKWEENKENLEDKQNEQKLKAAEVLSLKALEKELKYEERLEKEELMREKMEDEEMQNAYLCEERKNTNLLKALIQKKNSSQLTRKLEMEQKLNQIKKELKLKILAGRRRIQKKLNLLRLAHERKKNKYRQQIQDVRRKLTENMIKAEKKGDIKNCVSALKRNTTVEYCSAAFMDDPYSLSDCVKRENFCYLCCENEFGDMHSDDRTLCTNKCEEQKEILPTPNHMWVMANKEDGQTNDPEVNVEIDLKGKTILQGGNLLQ